MLIQENSEKQREGDETAMRAHLTELSHYFTTYILKCQQGQNQASKLEIGENGSQSSGDKMRY